MALQNSFHENNVVINNIGTYNIKKSAPSTKTAILTLIGIFGFSLAALYYFYKSFPELEAEEAQYLKLPLHIEDAKNLGKVLARYQEKYYFTVLLAFFLTYIFLQSFAIPGSIFLSILSGFLFPFPLAIFLVCTCSALGASFCFLLSSQLGRKVVRHFFPERAAQWAIQVEKHRSDLLNYIIFLRITPFLPNWFINITSPVIGVPATPFILGTFLGVAPPSFFYIQAGTTLHHLTSSGDALSLGSLAALGLMAALSLLPVLLKRKLQAKME